MTVDNSRFARIYTQLMSPVLVLRFLAHIIFFYISREKKIICVDLENECSQYKVKFKSKLLSLLWLLRFDTFFVTLFYYRLGPSKSAICRLTKSDNNSFMIIDGGRNSLLNVKMFHPFGTIVNAETIGNNLSIRNNTTIGNTHNSQSHRPTIGKNVEIGANSVIIGKIRIGDNVKIGAGTLINKDIPDNAIVVGNPFRIIGYNENT